MTMVWLVLHWSQMHPPYRFVPLMLPASIPQSAPVKQNLPKCKVQIATL
uniref:Uncharacterized protein n=1 Tax=Arundo donax TaxID=35708 RepID=A0A0A9E0R1_ARUDO